MYMANDTHRITIGDNEIEVPKWASESTLAALLHITKSSIVAEDVIKEVEKNVNMSDEEISALLEKIVDTVDTGIDDVAEAKKETLDKKIQGVAKSSKAMIDKFSNTDAPLSSMVDMAGDLGSAILGAGEGMAKKKGKDSAFAAGIGKSIPFVGAMGAGALAWSGFQAAQFEQFAKAQETMVNSGAIMFGGHEPYENLKLQSIRSGLTYTELSKLVSSHGVGLQSLGMGVSSGTGAFISMLKAVNKTGDKFGDYGLRSGEMAEVLAEYVNIQRMTLSKDMALTSTQDSVKASFHELMIETTALASLTGENRSELLQKRMAALAQPQVAAALKVMDENGGGHAEVARAFIAQFALLESSMGPVGKDISDKFNAYIFKIADQPENFDFSQAVGSDLATALNKANDGVVDRINDVFRSGDVEQAQKMIVEAMAEMRHAEVGSSNVVAGSVQDIIHQLAVAGNMVHTQMEKMNDMSESEYASYLKEIEEKSGSSSQMTVDMNNMKVSFMEVQNAFTLSVERGTAMAGYLSNALHEGAKTIQELLGVGVDDSYWDIVGNMFTDFSLKTVKAVGVATLYADHQGKTQEIPESEKSAFTKFLQGSRHTPDDITVNVKESNTKDTTHAPTPIIDPKSIPDHEKVLVGVITNIKERDAAWAVEDEVYWASVYDDNAKKIKTRDSDWRLDDIKIQVERTRLDAELRERSELGDAAWALADQKRHEDRRIFDFKESNRRELAWQLADEQNNQAISIAYNKEKELRLHEWEQFVADNHQMTDHVEIAKAVMTTATMTWLKTFFGGEKLIKQEKMDNDESLLARIDEAKKEAINLMERERFWAEKELHFADPANKDIPFVQKHRSQDETTHGWYDTPVDEIDDNAPNAHLEQVWATYSPKEMRAQREGESDRMYERLNERFNNKEDTREKTLLKAAKQFAHDLAGTVNPKKFRTSTTYSLDEGTHINMTPNARKFGGPVIKDKSYIVGEDGQEIFTPTGSGNITNANKTSLMLDSANNNNDDMSKHLEEMVAMKKQTVAVLKQMKAAMKSINRSKDYKRAVDNLA
jgi:hypothetical protein